MTREINREINGPRSIGQHLHNVLAGVFRVLAGVFRVLAGPLCFKMKFGETFTLAIVIKPGHRMLALTTVCGLF